MGDKDNNLHRRHLDHVRVCSVSSTVLRGVNSHLTMSRVHHQHREIGNDSNSGDRIPGHEGEHQYPASQPSSRQGETDLGGDGQNSQHDLLVSPTPVSFSGETQRSYPSYSTSPTVLPLLTERLTNSPSRQQSELRGSPIPLASLPRRALLVERTSIQMEWETSQAETRASGYQLRCLPAGLGSSLCRDTHRGCLVCTGTSHAHQLLGAASSHTCSEDAPEGCFGDLSTSSVGQYHGGGLRGHSVEPVDRPGQGIVDVGSRQGDSPVSPTYSRSVQHHSRHRIPNSQGQIGLDALPTHYSSHRGSIRPSGGGPICIQTNIPVTSLLQLETRSSGRGSRCIPAGLEPTEGICQSALVLDRQNPEPSSSTASSTGASSTSVAGSDLVPSTSRDVVAFPQADCTYPVPNPETNRLPDGDNSSTSCVACLQERFSGSFLSEEATKFLLQSWKAKSDQSYDSHFQKWAGWCAGNPVSGAASDVANFLAELHRQGYQSSLLNSFRSAISSAHDQVDGVTLGKHPLICRVLKGAFNARPPLLCYTVT